MAMTSRTKILVVAAVSALLGSFLLGFVPQYRRVKQLEAELSAGSSRIQSLESEAKFARLRDLASALFLETVNQNYGTASGRASELFNHVRSVASDPAASEYRSTLDGILALRDSVIGNLAKSDSSAQKQV